MRSGELSTAVSLLLTGFGIRETLGPPQSSSVTVGLSFFIFKMGHYKSSIKGEELREL